MATDDRRWQRPSEAIILVCRGCTARTALPIAAVVGTVLSAVNQGTVIADGHAVVGTWIRVAVNYLVPFLVASLGWLAARRVSPTEGSVSQPISPLGRQRDAGDQHRERQRAEDPPDTQRPPPVPPAARDASAGGRSGGA